MSDVPKITHNILHNVVKDDKINLRGGLNGHNATEKTYYNEHS